MTFMVAFRLHLSLLLCLVAGFATAQRKDTNPTNPANWNLTRVDQGEGKIKFLSWNTQTNQPTSYTYDLTHAEYGCSVDTPYQASLSSSCTGTTTFTVRWIGFGDGPATVLVHLAATSEFTNPDARHQGDGDPGLPVVNESSDSVQTYVDGVAYRNLTLSNKMATTTVSGNSSGGVTHVPTTYGYGSSSSGRWTSSCFVAYRALSITPAPVDTYYREVAPAGDVRRTLHTVTNLNECEMTVGLSLSSNVADDLEGNVSATATATLIGSWIPSVSYNWSSFDLTLPIGQFPAPPTTTWSHLANHSAIVAMAQGSLKMGDLTCIARDSSGLPPMSAKLRVNLHAPVEKVIEWESTEKGDEDSLVSEFGQPVRIYLPNVGQTASVTVTMGYAETQLPSTIVFKGQGTGDIAELIKLALGIDLSIPMDTQDQLSRLLARTYTAGPAAEAGEIWELRASTFWTEIDTIFADYAANGYSSDRIVGHIKPDTISVTPYLVKVGID